MPGTRRRNHAAPVWMMAATSRKPSETPTPSTRERGGQRVPCAEVPGCAGGRSRRPGASGPRCSVPVLPAPVTAVPAVAAPIGAARIVAGTVVAAVIAAVVGGGVVDRRRHDDRRRCDHHARDRQRQSEAKRKVHPGAGGSRRRERRDGERQRERERDRELSHGAGSSHGVEQPRTAEVAIAQLAAGRASPGSAGAGKRTYSTMIARARSRGSGSAAPIRPRSRRSAFKVSTAYARVTSSVCSAA